MPIDHTEIKRRRLYLGLSLTDAGERAGFGEGQRACTRWNDIETGRKGDIRTSTLEAVARALACRLQDLITDKPQGSSPPPPLEPGQPPG